MRTIVFGFLVLGMLTTTAPTHAGEQQQYAFCYHNSDGSGTCGGSFLAVRNSSDPNAYAYFWANAGGVMGFVAYISNTAASCAPQPGSGIAANWPQLMANRGFFQVSWNALGTCTSIYYRNGSLDSNY